MSFQTPEFHYEKRVAFIHASSAKLMYIEFIENDDFGWSLPEWTRDVEDRNKHVLESVLRKRTSVFHLSISLLRFCIPLYGTYITNTFSSIALT